jgi:hypothetical protein
VQITRITPLRRTILQFSQSFLTDVRTFISSLICVPDNPAFGHIEGRHFQHHPATHRWLGPGPPEPARQKRQHPVLVGELDPPSAVGAVCHDDTFNLESIAVQVKISGSDSVIRIVCSKWAAS